MNIIDQVKRTNRRNRNSIRKANLAEDIPEIEIPKDTKMEIILLILLWF